LNDGYHCIHQSLILIIVFVIIYIYRYIQENYSKIRNVERELQNLTLEMKLTAGPKKSGL